MQMQVMPDTLPALVRRELILELEKELLNLAAADDVTMLHGNVIVPLESRDFPIRHHFAQHSYGREMLLPKGFLVVGQIHKHAHVNVISRGKVAVYTEHSGTQVIEAPATFVSTPGTKRVVLPLEDTVWTTMHVVSMETPTIDDLPAIADEVIARDFSEVK